MQNAFSMHSGIDYHHVFYDAKLTAHHETPLLYAANYGEWGIVWYLLEKYPTHKEIKDNYGQSIFSKAIYEDTLYPLQQLRSYYSLEEINTSCKDMPCARNVNHELIHDVDSLVKDVLEEKKDLESKGCKDYTALRSVCFNEHVPLIVELLARGASLDVKNSFNNTPYDLLIGMKKTPLFVVREAFNNGPCMPAVFINDIFEQYHIVREVAQLIKQLYVKVSQNPFEAPEARIWKPVCVQACALAGMGDPDQNRCLARILLLPQKEKTELNIKLLLNNK